MELIRSLFVFRWKPVRRKPTPYNPIQRTLEYYKRAFSWIRRHWKLTLILVFVLPVVIGIIFRLTGVFDIYSYYDVDPVVQPKTGKIWDFIWELRGQPPGWEADPDGLWAIKETTPPYGGLNGPINSMFIPLEFWLVDLMIYLPYFLMGGLNWLTNMDIVTAYFLIPGLLYQRFLFSGLPGIVVALVAALIIAGFILLIPLIIGFYSVPILEFLFVNSISIIKLIVLVSILFVIILVPIAILNPEALQKFLGG